MPGSPKKPTTALIKMNLIAPCGLNCSLCRAFLREKNHCPGCNSPEPGKPKYWETCRIKHCAELEKIKAKYCFKCGSFPCARLKQLDKRYRSKYGLSLMANLESIQELGIREFTRREKTRWTCPDCGAIICVHKQECQHCGCSRGL